MASKKRQAPTSASSRMNFRPAATDQKANERGTKPTTPPSSMAEVFVLMVLHVCKKSMFFDTRLKVAIYMGALFLLSLISDFLPMPKTYFSKSSNIFNVYFVKLAWGWNLLLLMPFVLLTSYIYCCGKRDWVLKLHIPRLLIATFSWYFWVNFFNVIEANFGRCHRGDTFKTKESCLRAGLLWNGMDISGHSFILIYGSLVLMEESKAILNWEGIREFIRNEDYHRSTGEQSASNTPLKSVPNAELDFLKLNYARYTPYIRGLFISMTLLQMLWDVMLVSTIIYYHVMVEKFVGGMIAILVWYFTYHFWYHLKFSLPASPGVGVFNYFKKTPSREPSTARRRTGSIVNGSQTPRFMGMPIYRQEATPTESEAR